MLALALVALLATPPMERVGPYVEAHAGMNLAGEVEGAESGEAETGAAFGLRGGYRIIPWFGVGLAAEFATLPVSGLPSGNFTFVGLDLTGVLPTAYVDVIGGVAVGYDNAEGTYGSYSGFGGLRLRLGARVPIVDLFDLGLDYGLTMPIASDEIVVDGQTWHVVPAWLHQVAVAATLRFW